MSISSLQSDTPAPAKSSLSAKPTSDLGTGAGACGEDPSSDTRKHSTSDDGANAQTQTPTQTTAGGSGSRGSTPPASGMSTPTKTTPTPTLRKSRTSAFLDLAPLTGFLTFRGRGSASQKPSVHPVAEAPDAEGAHASLDNVSTDGAARGPGEAADVDSGDTGDDEDDRRTIRGVGAGTGDTGEGDSDELVEGKVIAGADACERGREQQQHPNHDANANANARAQGRADTTSRGREKVVGGGPVAQSPPLVMSS